VKTTVELPDDLFREAKATAARRGTALKEYFREAVAEKLARETAAIYPAREKQWPVPPPDVPLEELRRIDEFIEQAFERIDTEE
jgi:hypothetical protein